MGIIEIIAAIILIISCIIIVAVVLMQESKQGMSNVITGGSNDNYFQKNSGRTKEAQLARFTKVAAITFFIVAIAVNVVAIYWGGAGNSGNVGGNTTIESTDDAGEDVSVEESDDADVTDVSEDAEGEAPAEDTEATEGTGAAE